MLAAMRAPEAGGAQIAVTNIGGVRTSIVRRPDGVVTFGDLFAALPFSNTLVLMEYTGAQFQQALEEQWQGNDDRFLPLQVSQGLRYEWDKRRPQGQRIVPGSLTLNGQPIQPQQRLRVVVNSFLQSGGDGFPTLSKGQQVLVGPDDVQALEAYFMSHGNTPVAPTALDRVVRVDRGGNND
jgi:5'-nucleotidase